MENLFDNNNLILFDAKAYHGLISNKITHHEDRKYHGFAFKVNGKCKYTFSDGTELITEANKIIYLPKHSTYQIEFIEQTEQKGTAHAIYCARDKVNTPFAVINADDYYGKSAYKKMYDHLKQQKGDFCMVGFRLQNTLTENGTVARGICETENGMLKSVTERTKILDCKYTEDDINWVELPPDCVVSMNMWGFTPDVFDYIENDLKKFFAEKINVPKVEFYLPTVVSNVIERGQKDVTVLVAEDRWYGVTYKEDKDGVVSALKQKINNGEYEGF